MGRAAWWTGTIFLAASLAGVAQAQTNIPVPEVPSVKMVLLPVPAGADVDAALPEAIRQAGATQGGVAAHAQPTSVAVGSTTMRIEMATFNSTPGVAFFFMTIPEGRGICMAAVPLNLMQQAGAPTGKACLNAIGTAGIAPPVAATREPATPAPPAAPTRTVAPRAVAPAAHAANWAKVSDVYFRSAAGIGVGGMVAMRFSPVVLFKDGSYYEIDDAALEDIDLAAKRAAHPSDWGRWSRQGNRFTLTASDGRSRDVELQQGVFFKAYPATGTGPLVGDYKSLGGGGNTAVGGEVMIAIQDRYNFQPGGTYTTERSTGASSSGAVSGVGSTFAGRRAGQGRFSVDRHTITIERPDGRTERHFFAFGSRKTPPQLDKGMLFIGDAVYTLDD